MPASRRHDPTALEDDAVFWVRVTQMQIGRFVHSLTSAWQNKGRGLDAWVPAAADGHFVLIAAAQCQKALRRAGLDLPPERALEIRALRDVHEHWEQHQESFESETTAKTRSGAKLVDAHPRAMPWQFHFGRNGYGISKLNLTLLWVDLLRLEDKLEDRLAGHYTSVGRSYEKQNDPARPFPDPGIETSDGFSMYTSRMAFES